MLQFLGSQYFENPRGRAALAAGGRGILQETLKPHMYGDNFGNLESWVDFFLVRLRNAFPPVIITNVIEGEDRARKSDWVRGGLGIAQWESSTARQLYLRLCGIHIALSTVVLLQLTLSRCSKIC